MPVRQLLPADCYTRSFTVSRNSSGSTLKVIKLQKPGTQSLVNVPHVTALTCENVTQATVVRPKLKCHCGSPLSFHKGSAHSLGDATESKFTDFYSQVQE